MTTDMQIREVRNSIRDHDVASITRLASELSSHELADVLSRLPTREAAVVFRSLPKDVAIEVFDLAKTGMQADLVDELGDTFVADFFASLASDDQVGLLDELPAKVAKYLLQTLTGDRQQNTMLVLGYQPGSVGRRMSPAYIPARETESIGEVLERVRNRGELADSMYVVPVMGPDRVLLGVLSIAQILAAEPTAHVEEVMSPALSATATDNDEIVAARCVDQRIHALPLVDGEHRLVGMLTLDDAAKILRDAAAEDQARAGASEVLRRPYLATSVIKISRARIIWLLVLAVSAVLTVSVLEIFEATLEQQVILALFIPLLTGIGGNTGSQAATTVTRSLGLGELNPRDVLRVAGKEVRTGLLLGLTLGAIGFVVASLVYGLPIGSVIGLTLLAVCPMAATVGGVMPLVAKSCKVDPAVVSTPFISTFCDATGLLIYFTIAISILNL